MQQLIGLSLSFCIRDILTGAVKPEDVKVVVSNTALEDIMEILDPKYNYTSVYWRKHDEDSIRSALNKVRIYQPRLAHSWKRHSICHGHWMSHFQGFSWPHEEGLGHPAPVGTYYDPDTKREWTVSKD